MSSHLAFAINEPILLIPTTFDDTEHHKSHCEGHRYKGHHSFKSQLGTSGFSSKDPSNWYTIDTPPFPSTVPLSINRNFGFVEGDVELTPTGL